MAFAARVETEFDEMMRATRPKIEPIQVDMLSHQLNVGIDALVSAMVGISAKYVNKGAEFQEDVVNEVRVKFKALRKLEQEKKKAQIAVVGPNKAPIR